MNKKRQVLLYVTFDYLAALTAWALFFIYRKKYIEPIKFGTAVPVHLDEKFFAGILIIPLGWLLLHYISGYYREIFRKSRLQEFALTFLVTLIGVAILFFLRTAKFFSHG